MSLVAHDAAVLDAALAELLRQLDRAVGLGRAAAVHAGVALDQRADSRGAARQRRVERLDLGGVVDRDDQLGEARRQVDQSPQLRRADDLVRDQDRGADSGLCQRLRLPQLRTGDADRPRLELETRDLGALRGLVVRAQRGRPALEVARHPGDVSLQPVPVEQQRRGVDVGQRHDLMLACAAWSPG
jgi:hypothetical protein